MFDKKQCTDSEVYETFSMSLDSTTIHLQWKDDDHLCMCGLQRQMPTTIQTQTQIQIQIQIQVQIGDEMSMANYLKFKFSTFLDCSQLSISQLNFAEHPIIQVLSLKF